MKRRRLVLPLMLLALAPAAAGAASAIRASSAAQDETVRSVLDAYGKTLASRPAWRMECITDYTVDHAKVERARRAGGGAFHSTYLRDGEQVDVRLATDAEWSGTANDRTPIPPKPGANRNFRAIINGWYLSFEVSAKGRPAALAMFSADGAKFRASVIPAVKGLEAFEGYIAEDPAPLLDILRAAPSIRLRPDADPIDGIPCRLVEADSPDHGHYSVWFDPSAGSYPRKIVVEKGGDNLWSHKRLNEWKNFLPPGSKGPTTASVFTYTMDAARLEKNGSCWIPLGCRLTAVMRYADGNVHSNVFTCRRTKLDLNPDFGALGAFQPDLPEAARLVNEDNRQIPYEWRGGKPVPKVGKAAVEHPNAPAAAPAGR